MFSYDAVSYPDKPFRQATPDRLATMGILYGLDAAPPDKCRVLEVGCGAGGNIIPLADRFPESRYFGFDLAEKPIEQAIGDVQALGLKNVQFQKLDMMEFPEDAGEYDYIIAHGFFSWVPAMVRDKLLAVCQKHLAPHGVAYISYNAYPGGHFRNIWRDVMRFHTRGIDDVGEKLEQARAVMELLIKSSTRDDLEHRLAAEDWARFSNCDPNVLFHDDLSAIFEPFYFEDFVGMAGNFGLQYLAEAGVTDMEPRGVSSDALAALMQARRQSVILYEQYMDFFRFRRFRQTLLCRSEIAVNRDPQASDYAKFQYATTANPTPTSDPDAPKDAVTYHNPNNQSHITTNKPEIKAILERLVAAWPGTVGFGELSNGMDAAVASEILIQLTKAGLVEPSVESRSVPLRVSDRPEIWRISRHQAKRQKDLTSIYHGTVEITEAGTREALQLIDGTRSLSQLQKQFGPGIGSNLERLAKAGLVIR